MSGWKSYRRALDRPLHRDDEASGSTSFMRPITSLWAWRSRWRRLCHRYSTGIEARIKNRSPARTPMMAAETWEGDVAYEFVSVIEVVGVGSEEV